METLILEGLKVLPPGQLVVLGILLFIMKLIKDVRDQFRMLNGSVKEMKVWQVEHEKHDLQRHQEIRENLKSQWKVIEQLQMRERKE